MRKILKKIRNIAMHLHYYSSNWFWSLIKKLKTIKNWVSKIRPSVYIIEKARGIRKKIRSTWSKSNLD
jgi:hypothetical protein